LRVEDEQETRSSKRTDQPEEGLPKFGASDSRFAFEESRKEGLRQHDYLTVAHGRFTVQFSRRVEAGSTRVPLVAGMKHATVVTIATTSDSPTKVTGSVGDVPMRTLRSNRPA